ncbi:MAG: hypothetical protein NVSMB45_10300 [Ginsengibacter sp.]
MFKYVVFIFLSIPVIISSSCKKSIDDNFDKTQLVKGVFSYHRVLTYASPLPSKELLVSNRSDIDIVAVLNESHLLLSFYTKPFSDDIIFEVPISDLASEIIGTYKIKTKNSVEGVANSNFIFNFYKLQAQQHSFIIVCASFKGHGDLTITAYDQQQNAIAGTFSLNMEMVPDPTVDIIDQGPVVTRNCSIKIEGAFQNVLLHN